MRAFPAYFVAFYDYLRSSNLNLVSDILFINAINDGSHSYNIQMLNHIVIIPRACSSNFSITIIQNWQLTRAKITSPYLFADLYH